MEQKAIIRRNIKLKIADRTFNLWSNSDFEESLMYKASKLVNKEIETRMALAIEQGKKIDTQEVLSLICLDAMLARLKGDEDIKTIQKTLFDNLSDLQKLLGLTTTENN